jgi:hypothetical protein
MIPAGTDPQKICNRYKMKKVFALFAATAVFFSACKTDFKLTSNWKETMVIYALLNQSDSVQYIKINRTFLGPVNAYQMAAVHDSTNYRYLLNVKLERWSIGGGQLLGTYSIDTTTMLTQDAGAFANSPQVLYRVHTGASNPLLDDSEYHLTVVNPVTGYTATSTTILVQGVGSSSSTGLQVITPNSPFNAYNFFNILHPAHIAYMTGGNGRLYQVILRFHYTETTGTGTTAHYVDLNFGEFTSATTIGGETVDQTLSWDGFINFMNGAIPNDPLVASRTFGNCDLMVYAATDEFNTYVLVNQPISSITGDKPTYTNIKNGIGLFSARYSFISPNYSKPLSVSTIDQLTLDSRTCHLMFQDHTGAIPPCH